MSCCSGPKQCRDFDDDREGVSGDDLARFGDDGVACPNCGSDVFHDAALCHSCGYAITNESLRKPMPAWIPIVAVACITGLLMCYFLWML